MCENVGFLLRQSQIMMKNENEQKAHKSSLELRTCFISAGINVVITEWLMASSFMFMTTIV